MSEMKLAIAYELHSMENRQCREMWSKTLIRKHSEIMLLLNLNFILSGKIVF